LAKAAGKWPRSRRGGARSASISETVHIRFRRSGGIFAGNRLELELDEAELSDAVAAALRGALEGEGLARFAEPQGHTAGADEYQYDLTVRRGEEVVSLRFTETQLPPELAPLIYALEEQAERRR
jgi:emfourin